MGYLTEKERYYIEVYLKNGYSVKQIAKELNRHISTIYREIKRGSVELLDYDRKERVEYCADYAQTCYRIKSSNKGRDLKIGNNLELADFLEYKMKVEKYSPYCALQLAVNAGFTDLPCRVTLYSYIEKGVFYDLSYKDLPNGRPHKKKNTEHSVSLNNPLSKSIDDRPKIADLRIEYGHWEMDTVVSGVGYKSCLLVLTERATREQEIYKMPDKTIKSTVATLDMIEHSLGTVQFKNRYKTITCDNGCEFLNSQAIETSCISVNCKRTELYYCHPYCSRERGSNENANKLIRRFIKKGSDIGSFTYDFIKKVENFINTMPRRIFNGLSSIEYKEILLNCIE